MVDITAEQIVRLLHEAGYFDRGNFYPSEFEGITHAGVRLGAQRALDVLAGAEFTKFEYDSDPDLHPKDKLDHWRVVLTEKGQRLISQ